ncbi:glycosyltransferase [Prolixibacteraceae bacterium Z1-6]|uniref:Glycosyltransferase n=1 Tax=Draconibacterium aestuarii TaxID=2998507 RepID=A0A9X3F6W2_9BACT|nr:glycosyltransferase [Prolixibacteraceae bacterium Z1-6]
MSEAIIITPVKDSLTTTKRTIEAISKARGNFEYYIFNDFSNADTKMYLEQAKKKYNFQLIHLEDITNTPSPNYKLVLQTAQKIAVEKNCPLGIIESDVVIKNDTLSRLINLLNTKEKPGLVGAITVDESDNYNFPYNFEKIKNADVLNTSHSLSFCCTLISAQFLKEFNFTLLSDNKDWFDVFISRQSKKLGYNNYLAKGIEVLHLPHSSRPWKNLKYKNPVLYYLKKIFLKRDRI